MPTAIVPLSEVRPSLAVEYLRGRGLSPEIIQWKYFDPRFNAHGERGLVALTDGRPCGLIGLIPFSLGRQAAEIRAAWSCDWSVQNHQANPFVGVMLLKRAIGATGLLLAVGGNANSQRLFRHVADVSVAGAAHRFDLPLRIGAMRDRLERRFPATRLGHRSPHWNIAIPRRRRGARVRWEEGVHRGIEPLLTAGTGGAWRPRYGFEYVDWQIGRCPALEAWTCYFDDGDGPRAAALSWRLRGDDGVWRVALWGAEGEPEPLAAVLDGVVDRAFCDRGFIVSVRVSRVDATLAGVLKTRGFRLAESAPLFVCGGVGRAEAVDEVADLNYLSTDFGYRR